MKLLTLFISVDVFKCLFIKYLKKEADKRRLPLSTYVRQRILYKEEKEENQQSKSTPLC